MLEPDQVILIPWNDAVNNPGTNRVDFTDTIERNIHGFDDVIVARIQSMIFVEVRYGKKTARIECFAFPASIYLEGESRSGEIITIVHTMGDPRLARQVSDSLIKFFLAPVSFKAGIARFTDRGMVYPRNLEWVRRPQLLKNVEAERQ